MATTSGLHFLFLKLSPVYLEKNKVLSEWETDSGCRMRCLEISEGNMSRPLRFTASTLTDVTVYGIWQTVTAKVLLNLHIKTGETSASKVNPTEILWNNTDETH